jgi:psp operon transcriptional activator
MEVDARIIAATNADLVALTAEGRFKQDLLDRLSFEVLFLPALRDRKEDILLLANHFATRMAFELGREEIPQFSDDAIAALESYSWPGNVRELKNLVERAVYRSDSSVITEIVFDPFRTPLAQPVLPEEEGPQGETKKQSIEGLLDKPFNEAVKELEIHLLKKALKQAKYNQKKAAQILGLTYHQFRGVYRKYSKDVK